MMCKPVAEEKLVAIMEDGIHCESMTKDCGTFGGGFGQNYFSCISGARLQHVIGPCGLLNV